MNSRINALLGQLLFASEGDSLDFKRDQYPFSGATDEQKSELLKDILAFANAWRRDDAYILIGVEEVKGGRANIVGLASHLEDANLQQFVSGKTSSPVTFSYHPVEFERKQIGVIQIPLQRRPVYLKKAYGKLEAEKVYLRRGSSTDFAKPDEIAQMGQAFLNAIKPSVRLSTKLVFANTTEAAVECKTDHLVIPVSELPDFGYMNDMGLSGLSAGLANLNVNNNYWRELATYECIHRQSCKLQLLIENHGDSAATDFKVILELKKHGREVLVAEEYELPLRPSEDRWAAVHEVALNSIGSRQHLVSISKTNDTHVVTFALRKLLAKEQLVLSDVVCFIAKSSREVSVNSKILATELANPVLESHTLKFAVDEVNESCSEFLRRHGCN
ncbi:MAG: ATP-binding protein [Burkholderiales bacterium]|nr:MAG: ATP-binding protein [Burkholderiales bacterium]TAG84363.1 MAG: ATP-binding protein [Betaproteobacteria bacterium]